MQFVNPYNFIATDFSQDTKMTEAKKGMLSGVIECSLFTRTPLAIPGERINEKHKNHHRYKFMRCGDELMIPGSSLRGVIRTMYETVTDSCYVTTDPKKVITIRSNDPYKAGLLMREQEEDGNVRWKLYRADRYIVKIKNYVREAKGDKKGNDFTKEGWYDTKKKEELLKIGLGSKVYFKNYETRNGKDRYEKTDKKTKKNHFVGYYAYDVRKPDQFEKEVDEDEGYLYIGEFFSKKHFESIFTKGTLVQDDKNIINDAMERLDEIVEVYRKEKINSNYKEKPSRTEDHTGYKQYEKAKSLGVIPVWYDISETGNLYLSMACIGRMAYKNRMGDLLNQKVACHSKTKLCKACALFGFVGKGSEEDRKEAIGSRIRVTDAFLAEGQEDAIMGFYRLRELSSPKESYMPFYLKHEKEEKSSKKNVWSYDADGVTLRGRKFYWHWDYETYKQKHPNMTYIPYEREKENENEMKIQPTDRNATMELVKPKQEFRFKIYFDQITKQQLQELLWTVSLGTNDANSGNCYKIGHGKPLGLGSVKIVINKVLQRIFDSDLNYQEQELPIEIISIDMDQKIKNAWKRIVGMRTVQKEEVRYPYVVGEEHARQGDNNYAAHQWFKHNFKLGDDSPKKPLQDISKEQNLVFCPVEESANNETRNGGNQRQRYNNNRRR